MRRSRMSRTNTNPTTTVIVCQQLNLKYYPLNMPNLLVLSLPSSAAPSGGDPQTQLDEWLRDHLDLDKKQLGHFILPSLKIGTLDNLVQQSEDLTRIDNQAQGIVHKMNEMIESLYSDNESSTKTNTSSSSTSSGANSANKNTQLAQIAAAKRVADRPDAEAYMFSFNWNASRYRPDKPIGELVELLSKEIFGLDTDARNQFQQYGAAKSNLSAVDRRQTGNLSVKSLHDVVKRENFVLDSEYLTTVLVAVPKVQTKEFNNSYETLVPMVVPRSATTIASDSEYVLYGVSVFKKYQAEFVAKCRDHKWTPRDFKYDESTVSIMRKEHSEAAQTERKLYADTVRLCRAAYSDIIQGWAHLKAIKVFVESVLRYGLPPDFLTNVISCRNTSSEQAAVKTLIKKFGYLGGKAFEKDKRGRLLSDNDLSEYGALVDMDYKPFVVSAMEL